MYCSHFCQTKVLRLHSSSTGHGLHTILLIIIKLICLLSFISFSPPPYQYIQIESQISFYLPYSQMFQSLSLNSRLTQSSPPHHRPVVTTTSRHILHHLVEDTRKSKVQRLLWASYVLSWVVKASSRLLYLFVWYAQTSNLFHQFFFKTDC